MNEIECIITGRVHMVMFRDFACRRGRKLGVNGTVENLPDGSVRVIAQGEREKLMEFETLLKKGPLLAKVKDVRTTWREPSVVLEGFNIVY